MSKEIGNTWVRIISGAVYFGLILTCLLVNSYLFAALIVFMTVTMMAEFYRMTMGDSYIFSRILGIVAGIGLFLMLYLVMAFGVDGKFMALSLVPIMVVMFNSLLVKDKQEFLKFAYIYTGILYIAVPMALSNFLAFREGEFDGLLILCFFFIIWFSDIGAYAIGSTLGKKFDAKLAPEISPRKTWTGFWGGLVMAVLCALVLHWTGMLTIPLVHCIAIAVVMHLGAVAGDLFESMWKRCCHVKDSGRIIPGHGGMLDRLDSTIVSMPLGAIYLAVFNFI